jgi:predicted Fe-Mo cluster-binding NifX family protein
MRIAKPLSNGRLAAYFGHCQQFALIDVELDTQKNMKREDHGSPPHEPGLLPSWLAQPNVNAIIAGGMGQRAQGLFQQRGINVVVGVRSDSPEQLVDDYLSGDLISGENLCNH